MKYFRTLWATYAATIVLGVLGMWFGWVAFTFADDLLIGGKVAIAASGGLFVGTIVERWRGLEVLGVRLSDRRYRRQLSLEAPSAPPQLVPHQLPV